MINRLAIISTHPIQYYAPLFKLLANQNKISIKVFYTWGIGALNKKYDPDFKKEIDWDIPLLDGYEYEFLANIAKDPGSHHYKGISNPDIIEKISEYEPDSVLVIGWNFKSHLKVMRYFKGKTPVLFRGDSTVLDQRRNFPIKNRMRKIFLHWIYSHVDKALYVGSANKAYFKNAGLREDQLVFAPHAIDNSRFADTDGIYSERAIQWRKELGIKLSSIVFLYCGKFEKKKNPLGLVRAFISVDLPDVKLILVGDGILEVDLKQLAAGDDRIVFLPFQNQSLMPVVYRMGDVFV